MNSAPKPLISFVLIAYKQEAFIREAVAGALSQDYEPLEIILSDDCSPDRTFEIIEEEVAGYRGPHTVRVNRNEPNLGLCGHFNRVMELAKGEIIVIAAGDDVSLPDRVSRSWEILRKRPEMSLVSLGVSTIDSKGDRIGQRKKEREFEVYTLEEFIRGRKVKRHGASRAFRRTVHDTFGPLGPACTTEDTTTWLRGVILGTAGAGGGEGVLYRVHGENLWANGRWPEEKFRAILDQYIADIEKAATLGLLDAKTRERLTGAVTDRHRESLVNSQFERSKTKFRYFLSEILTDPAFSLKRKLKYLRRSFR